MFSLLVVGLVLIYAGLLLVLWRFQEQVVFQPPKSLGASPVPARQVHYRASDGVDLFAYVVGDDTSHGTVLLAFHGNAEVSRWLVPWAIEVSRLTDACVVLPEYRGYDGLSGVPSYEASGRDARAALAYVRDSLRVAPANTVYFGHSLGSAIAAELAAVDPPRALVLQAPFSSAREMAARLIVPGLSALWRFISRVHFDTFTRVRLMSLPVSVAHGDRDIIVPVHMGRAVFNAAREKGELLVIHGAGHNDIAAVGGADYWRWLAGAVRGGSTMARAVQAERRSAP